MKLPTDIQAILSRRFQAQHRDWLLAQSGEHVIWPLEINLGLPSEQVALRQPEGVRNWVSAWQRWQGVGDVHWIDRRWRSLGTQRLPERLTLSGPAQVAQWVGESDRWNRAQLRYSMMLARWPLLADGLSRHFGVLADYSDEDFQRAGDLLDWLLANPRSNLYPRQLPVSGLDSKWLESRRKIVLQLLVGATGEGGEATDFYQRSGLRATPRLIRLRLLDPHLRACCGGLGDVTAPLSEVARMVLPVRQVIVVENLQTGLAFEDLPGTVLIIGLGYGVDVLGALPWLATLPCHYWGDLDTHGFAMLDRARRYLPKLRSLLMDEATLVEHRLLWGTEECPFSGDLPLLNEAEQALYMKLRTHDVGPSVRMEQERIDWSFAWSRVTSAAVE